MNAIEKLEKKIAERFPKAILVLDAPESDTGSWFLDISWNGQAVTIEWQKKAGFGISANRDIQFGEGADELFFDYDTAWKRARALLLSHQSTKPSLPIRLGKLRTEFGISQVELARRLDVNQAAVSKLENRLDMKIGTLRQVIEAMGGKLSIVAEFEDGVREIHFEEEQG